MSQIKYIDMYTTADSTLSKLPCNERKLRESEDEGSSHPNTIIHHDRSNYYCSVVCKNIVEFKCTQDLQANMCIETNAFSVIVSMTYMCTLS